MTHPKNSEIYYLTNRLLEQVLKTPKVDPLISIRLNKYQEVRALSSSKSPNQVALESNHSSCINKLRVL